MAFVLFTSANVVSRRTNRSAAGAASRDVESRETGLAAPVGCSGLLGPWPHDPRGVEANGVSSYCVHRNTSRFHYRSRN